MPGWVGKVCSGREAAACECGFVACDVPVRSVLDWCANGLCDACAEPVLVVSEVRDPNCVSSPTRSGRGGVRSRVSWVMLVNCRWPGVGLYPDGWNVGVDWVGCWV